MPKLEVAWHCDNAFLFFDDLFAFRTSRLIELDCLICVCFFNSVIQIKKNKKTHTTMIVNAYLFLNNVEVNPYV